MQFSQVVDETTLTITVEWLSKPAIVKIMQFTVNSFPVG
jgi:hypothetical protein